MGNIIKMPRNNFCFINHQYVVYNFVIIGNIFSMGLFKIVENEIVMYVAYP